MANPPQSPTTFDQFSRQIMAAAAKLGKGGLVNESNGIGRFGIFDLEDLHRDGPPKVMPYNRRTYYKISLVHGPYRAEYADKTIRVRRHGLFFATPNIPYNWIAEDNQPRGTFCVFTRDFLAANSVGTRLDQLPIFRTGGLPFFEIEDSAANAVSVIFKKMMEEKNSDYAYRYDLLRTYVLELIHLGQKLQPENVTPQPQTAASRIVGLFQELLERQLSPLSPDSPIELRTAGHFADRLALHVNYLNQVLKSETGKTTSQVIGERLIQESKVLLRHSDWTVSEIAYALGFEEVAHFSNFFKKHTDQPPLTFRG
ncbi:MAG: helix-turn-helix transcriptional regulator [Lewinella sp.]